MREDNSKLGPIVVEAVSSSSSVSSDEVDKIESSESLEKDSLFFIPSPILAKQ